MALFFMAEIQITRAAETGSVQEPQPQQNDHVVSNSAQEMTPREYRHFRGESYLLKHYGLAGIAESFQNLQPEMSLIEDYYS